MAILSAVAVTPDLRPSYPHMGKGDADVWEQWLYNNQDLITAVYYDVTRGGVIIDDPLVDQAMRDGWQYTTAIKIDAVALFDTENLIIEVKPRANMGAIGQALGYAMLMDDEPINDNPNVPCIVTLSVSAEVQKIADALGIRIDIVKTQES